MHATFCADKYIFSIDFLLGSAGRNYRDVEKSFCLRYLRECTEYELTFHHKPSALTPDVVIRDSGCEVKAKCGIMDFHGTV